MRMQHRSVLKICCRAQLVPKLLGMESARGGRREGEGEGRREGEQTIHSKAA